MLGCLRQVWYPRWTVSPEGLPMSTPVNQARASDLSIFARFLGDAQGELPPEVARAYLSLKISERDKARMHDLAVRNRQDVLTPEEKEELLAFGRAGDMLA